MKSSVEAEYWQRFLGLLLQCKTKTRLDEMMHLFLTMNERGYLIDRYRIVEAILTTEQSQREIAKNLNVSITKITDGSKAIQIISDKFRAFLLEEMHKT
jgi:TrpR family transcriptional regulator, trp operon repressor